MIWRKPWQGKWTTTFEDSLYIYSRIYSSLHTSFLSMWFFHVLCEKYPPAPPPKKKKNQDQCYAYCHPVFCFAPTTMPTNFPKNKKKYLEDPDVKSTIPSGPPIPIPCVQYCLVQALYETHSFWIFLGRPGMAPGCEIYFDHWSLFFIFLYISTSTLSETNISPKIEDWKIMCFPVWRGFLVGTMVVSGKASKQNGCLGVLDLGPQKSQQKRHSCQRNLLGKLDLRIGPSAAGVLRLCEVNNNNLRVIDCKPNYIDYCWYCWLL